MSSKRTSRRRKQTLKRQLTKLDRIASLIYHETRGNVADFANENLGLTFRGLVSDIDGCAATLSQPRRCLEIISRDP